MLVKIMFFVGWLCVCNVYAIKLTNELPYKNIIEDLCEIKIIILHIKTLFIKYF